MRYRVAFRMSLCLLLVSAGVAAAQSAPDQAVPRLINISGVYRPADGQPAGPVATVTLSIYADQQGGSPVWQETQTVPLDAQGRYSLLLGATRPDGIPAEVFSEDAAHWLGTMFERGGEVEGPRTRLTSVPYALRAAAADTLGGRPASDYQLTPTAGGTKDGQAANAEAGTSADVVLAGTPNFLAKYVNNADVGNSGVFEAADNSIGLGTTTPFDRLHIRYDNNTGDFTGLAVQNTNGGAFAYSGMLFYDHTNALTQFQGYNNLTHEYRINNIARVSPGGAFNGTINFMIGGTSRFFVGGNAIGIGTTSPAAPGLEVSNALGGASFAYVAASTFGNNTFGSTFNGTKARGTQAAPTAVQVNDRIAFFGGVGWAATHPGVANGMEIKAAENYTDTAQGTSLNFFATDTGTNISAARMTITGGGNVGIGTLSPLTNLEVSNALQPIGTNGGLFISTYGNTNTGSSLEGRKARGTQTSPTQVLNGDALLFINGRGFGTTLSRSGASIVMRATENFTDTTSGTMMQFLTAANGTTAVTPRMTIDQNGFVGIGTTAPNGMLDINRNGTTNVYASSYGTSQGSGFKGRVARGTLAVPTATQSGDELAEFTAAGHDGTDFLEGAGWAAFAAENWTNAAHGTVMGFFATPLGGSDAQLYMSILPSGNIGIGTPTDVNGFPTATDRLQVFGDARVGNAGTNGCVKRFDGTALAGTCSSDRRFKKDITPFGSVLNQLTALQPVHYFWRAEDFPARHFGNTRTYGLIAQDVEVVLPELVATDGDGYKAVDYSKLPLLTIQAVKELKAENDAQKAENDARKAENEALKQRVAELERLVAGLLAATRR